MSYFNSTLFERRREWSKSAPRLGLQMRKELPFKKFRATIWWLPFGATIQEYRTI